MNIITIVIPVHNGEKTLKRCLKSILNQSYKNLEIILIENFSSDASLKVCQYYKSIDKRIKYFVSNKKGTTFARKLGIEHATGKYLLFCDQDDMYYDRYSIENMYNYMASNDVQICQFGRYVKHGKFIVQNYPVTNKLEIIERNDLINGPIAGLWGEDLIIELLLQFGVKCMIHL